MKVCLICTEFLGWGKAGGYGFATRSLGRALSSHGIEVYAVIPLPRGITEPVLEIDGIQILGYPRYAFKQAMQLFRDCDADIFHSQEPSIGSWLAQRAMPGREHVVTSRDPRLLGDWWIEFLLPTHNKLQVLKTYLHYENPCTHSAVRHADAVFCPANFLIPITASKYHLSTEPGFLPTPVKILPKGQVVKDEQPTVCYVGRWDRRKQMEIFFELAKQFPSVQFIAPGEAQDKEYDEQLREQYSSLANLSLPGFLNQFEEDELAKIYQRSWILINTAAREGLPNTFVEACGYACAILSPVDPDHFASQFGYFVEDKNFAKGLSFLLENNHWHACGERGYNYVKQHYETEQAVERHKQIYTKLLANDG